MLTPSLYFSVFDFLFSWFAHIYYLCYESTEVYVYYIYFFFYLFFFLVSGYASREELD